MVATDCEILGANYAYVLSVLPVCLLHLLLWFLEVNSKQSLPAFVPASRLLIGYSVTQADMGAWQNGCARFQTCVLPPKVAKLMQR